LNIAIIPARKNSRRIKNKNIIKFNGKPIIFYSLKVAKQSNLFDKIIVTTDSKKIEKLAYLYGADFVIKRKKKLSNDKTGIVEVIKDAIKILSKIEINPDYVCCIFPASPNINLKYLKDSFIKIKRKKTGFIFAAGESLQNFSDCFFFDKKTLIKVKELNVLKKYLSKKLYIDAGQFYWAKKLTWLNSKTTFQKNSSIELIKNRKYADINTHDDLKYAEYLFESK
jgi:pseudaminic acid cytidylyltransferase